MASRAELKQRAKNCLRKYYWKAFFVCLLAGILGGAAGTENSGINFTVNLTKQTVTGESISNGFAEAVSEVNPGMLLAMMSMFSVIMVIAWLVALLWGTFVGNVVRIGSCRFFLESRETMEATGIGKLFYGFEKGQYLNVVKVMFMRGLYVFLWSLLFIIPGIVKAYQYAMVPYILADDPTMDYRDVLNMSKDMMQGYKWNYFVLEISFAGWYLLGMLLCGLGGVFVNPYMQATATEFYAVRRDVVWNIVEERPDETFPVF